MSQGSFPYRCVERFDYQLFELSFGYGAIGSPSEDCKGLSSETKRPYRRNKVKTMWTKIKLILLSMCMGFYLCGCTTTDVQPTSTETVKLVIDPVLLEPVPPLIYLK